MPEKQYLILLDIDASAVSCKIVCMNRGVEDRIKTDLDQKMVLLSGSIFLRIRQGRSARFIT